MERSAAVTIPATGQRNCLLSFKAAFTVTEQSNPLSGRDQSGPPDGRVAEIRGRASCRKFSGSAVSSKAAEILPDWQCRTPKPGGVCEGIEERDSVVEMT
jgi:hypothetical protein